MSSLYSLKPMIVALAALSALSLTSCSNSAPKADHELATFALKTLSDDVMQGRKVGTDGAARARAFIVKIATPMNRGVEPDIIPYTQEVSRRGETRIISGKNIIIPIAGRVSGGPVLDITAHYDHVGVRDGEIYNGADDNASGVGALLAILKSFSEHPPEHDVNIIWLDGEESGLSGAYAYVSTIDDRPRLNMNLDMISQNEAGEIYMAGSHHTPALKPLIETAAKGTNLSVKFGHDRPEDGPNDWTLQSDHGAFHTRGISFVYFGVEDHEHYHQPTDTFESIPLSTYRGAVQLSVNTAHILDEQLDDIARAPNSLGETSP